MNYSENYQIRKTSTDVTGSGANYTIKYTVRNPIAAGIDLITAVIMQTGDSETRVGSGSLDVTNNRHYFAIEKHGSVSMDNQALLAAQYLADVKQMLTK